MIEFVVGSFALALLPMVLDLGSRIVMAATEIFWWTPERMVKHARNGCHPIHRNPAPMGPL
jgi:hypothetical protein